MPHWVLIETSSRALMREGSVTSDSCRLPMIWRLFAPRGPVGHHRSGPLAHGCAVLGAKRNAGKLLVDLRR